MAERYTSADVRRAFSGFIAELRESGVDVTHVQLTITGNTGRALTYSVINVPGMTSHVIQGSREMWDVLHFATQALRATRHA